jgi:hypothetical protein
MPNFPPIRNILFRLGVMTAFLSVGVWLSAYFHHTDTTDYIKQAHEAIPWINTGLLLSLIAVVLCCFGRSWKRITGIAASIALLCFWILIAESNF